MRGRAALLLLGGLLLGGPTPRVAAAEAPSLDVPPKVDGLRLEDVDGDGRTDLLTVAGRQVRVWLAPPGGLPAAAPTWTVDLPDDASFVDVSRTHRPALLVLGAAQAARLPLDQGRTPPPVPIAGTAGLGWRDPTKAALALLHPGAPGDPRAVLPTATGWRLVGAAGLDAARALPAPYREVVPGGPFLEDTGTVREVLPAVLPERGDADRVWALAGESLTCLAGRGAAPYDVSFLPPATRRRLVDLDADGTPDLATGEGDNRGVRYAFFRVPPPVPATGPEAPTPLVAGGDLRPPAAFLRLAGYPLEPDLVDLDRDGRLDLVSTTIAVDGPNFLRALTSGKVTATTLAFLQRAKAEGVPMFPSQPDAVVVSDIGVKVRFGFAGTIEVTRSFTIVATADLDADGRRDLVIRTGPSTLLVRRGTAAGVWEKEPRSVTIPALAAGEELEAYAADLDGRPGDELALLYRAPEGTPDRLVLLRP